MTAHPKITPIFHYPAEIWRPDPGRRQALVDIWSPEVNIRTRCEMTGPAVLVPHHHEGWQQIQRMMRMSYTEWQGASGWELQIPVLFDGLRANWPVTRDTRALENLSIPTRKFDPMRPPVIKFDSRGEVPHDVHHDSQKLWIIAGSGLQWGDYITNRRHQRIRQFCTINLWEYITDQVIVVSLHNQIYTIKRGDTLQKIAAKFYGNKSHWRRIAKVNHIRDPNHPKVGKKIKLP